MVSNAVTMPLPDLLAALARIRNAYKNDPEYVALRKEFPKSWPL